MPRFFLGHTELLGIGAGTGATRLLTGLAEWATSDANDSQIYETRAGDTVASISSRTGVPIRSLRRENPHDLPGRAEPTPGMRVAALGIRDVRAIRGHTLGTVARQNGVTVAALAAANGFAPGAPDSTALTAGRRLIIARRR